jgi:hypothetical protein
VAAFHPAIHEAGRLAPEVRSCRGRAGQQEGTSRQPQGGAATGHRSWRGPRATGWALGRPGNWSLVMRCLRRAPPSSQPAISPPGAAERPVPAGRDRLSAGAGRGAVAARRRSGPASQSGRFPVIHVGAPGSSAHHPGITPGRVIRGERDDNSMGRGVRVAGLRVPASTLIALRTRRPGDGARVLSRTDGQPTPGSPGFGTPVRSAIGWLWTDKMSPVPTGLPLRPGTPCPRSSVARFTLLRVVLGDARTPPHSRQWVSAPHTTRGQVR